MLCWHLANSTRNFHMPGVKKILTTAVIVLVVMAVVNRVPQLKAITG